MAYRLVKPVFFVGFMGAGKTSVSRYLAATCGLASIDADEYLELQEDRSIAALFTERGEDYFRTKETQYLEELAKQPPCFISCGGGVVLREENIALMHSYGYVVYLLVAAEDAARRIPHPDTRPLFKDLDTARATLEKRIACYEKAAHVQVDTRGCSVAEVAVRVQAALLGAGVLVQDSA